MESEKVCKQLVGESLHETLKDMQVMYLMKVVGTNKS